MEEENMRNKMRILFMAGILCVTFHAPGNLGHSETLMAQGLQNEIKISEETVLQLLSYDAKLETGLAVVNHQQKGSVTGDGVRLRSAPNASGTILEKMYNGELVIIKGESAGWYNVQRIKTGTIGWASTSYITKIN